ncbi:MAG TPA: L-fucose:H+ symporter permease [Bryobacteraceae bacterium]|nr:L-fucose:H+ symporter permease [Bryobacteraceae bacterium]
MSVGRGGSPTSELQKHKMFSRENLVALVLVTALFFLWGIPNNLNDVLIRQFMKSFAITRFEAGLVQSAFYLGYFVLSMPAALLMRRFGYKTGLVTGLFLYAAGAFLFWPAALSQSYGFFLVGLFVIASGLAFLETGANPFIAQLGDPVAAERRLNFAQAFNPLGSIVGVLIGTTFIFSGIELNQHQIDALKVAKTYNSYLQHETMRVIMPYLVLGCVVILWAILIIRTKFPKVTGEEGEADTSNHGRFRDLLKYPHFMQAVLAQFFYVGAQVGTWSYFIQYVQDYVHGSEKTAGYFLTGTLVAFGVGRFAATYLMRFVEPNVLMGFYSLANVLLVAVGVLFPGWLGLWAIFLTSFFMSLMYPTIFALGLRGLGPNTKIGGSLIVMGIVGGAVFTPLMGLVFGATMSMAKAMLVPLCCYVFIAYFAFIGSQMRPRIVEPQAGVAGAL